MDDVGKPREAAACRGRALRARAGLWVWLCGWLLAAGFVGWHAVAVERYLDRVTATSFTSEPVDTPLRRVPQAVAPDGQVWVRHALGLAETGAWRLRSTDIDNAPEGRPVYWNSGWALWLEACGRVRRAFTAEPLPAALEAASLWANLPLFLLVMTLASGWTWLRWGGRAGAFMAVGLAGHRSFYEGFYPAYCDHHGLISACLLGLVLGAVLAGGGWWRRCEDGGEGVALPRSEPEVMRAATISAACGALGLWVSAASAVPVIAVIGLAVIGGGLMWRPAENGTAVCAAAAWRRWGRVGGLVSSGLYLLENAPDRLAWRLEANHPLYSLAWWAAGEIMAAVLIWKTERRPVRWLAQRTAGWLGAVLAAPAVIAARGAEVFAPLDPFLGRIHASIHEFEPLARAVARAGWPAYGDQVFIAGVLLVLATLWLAARGVREERMIVVLAGAVALAATAQGMWQNRWLLTAGGAQVVFALVLVLALAGRLRSGWRGPAVAAAAAAMFLPGPWKLAREREHVETVRDVQMGETMQLLYRDIAAALLKAGADGRSVVLASPNASVGVGYYGRLRTAGTLYWENRDGLRTAAEILGSADDAEAAARVHTAGITHVVMVSSYDFLAEYAYASDGVQRLPGGAAEGFGGRLLHGRRVPPWLRPLDYRVPAPLAPLGFKVDLYAVDFEAPPALAHERIGIHQWQRGERALAEKSFLASLAADSDRAEAWLRMGRVLLEQGRLAEAANFIRAGIARTPDAERERRIKAAAAWFGDQGEAGRAYAESLLGMTGR